MQPITGTIQAVEICYDRAATNAAQSCLTVVVSETDARDACHFIRQPVQVWLVNAVEATPSECTPETYAYLKARLAAAEDNLAREVRSNQAAALVRADIEANYAEAVRCLAAQMDNITNLKDRCEEADECLASRLATIGKMRDERDAALADAGTLHLEREHVMGMVNDRDAKVLALSLDNDRLAAERDMWRGQAESDAAMLRYAQDKCATLHDDNDRLAAALTEAQDEAHIWRSANASLRAEVVRLGGMLAEADERD